MACQAVVWSGQGLRACIQSACAPLRRDSLRFFCCAPKRTSKMTASKLPTGSAFQIFFECTRFALRFERNGGFDSPWSVLQSVWTCASIVLEQALFKITCNARVVDRLFRLAHQNINVKEVFHLAGLPSRSLGAHRGKSKHTARLHFVTAWQPSLFRCAPSEGWARQDSNLGPRDYESPALTAELQARIPIEKAKCRKKR